MINGDLSGVFEITGRTFQGLEEVLANEITALGGQDAKPVKRAVLFKGDLETLYKVNLWSRTALNFVVPIADFKAKGPDELYERCMELEWDVVMNNRKSFAIETTVHSSHFSHSKYAGLKVKDAIADYFRNNTGKRPNVNRDRPDVSFHLRISEDHVTISMNSSGEPLFKRGYRHITNIAPINEVLAAGMIDISGWNGDSNFVDPMCGSGTIPIEAAIKACNIAPGLMRNHFGFMRWRVYDKEMWHRLKDDALDKIKAPGCRIVGSDISAQTMRKARRNAENLPLEDNPVQFFFSDIKDYDPPEGGGVLITNPPYDERFKVDNISELYSMIGDAFKSRYSGYSCWIFSANLEAMKSVGLKPTRKVELWNGPRKATFRKFEIYEGSMKTKSENDGQESTQKEDRREDKSSKGRHHRSKGVNTTHRPRKRDR